MILLDGIKAVHSFLRETSKLIQDKWNQTLLYVPFSSTQIWTDLHTVIEFDSPSFINLNI